MRHLVRLTRLAVVMAAAATQAIQTTTTFTLEAVRTEKRFGPFELRGGANVILGTDLYRMRVDGGGDVTFVNAANNDAFGPYEIIEGRIVPIGGVPYTIVDIQTIAVSSPAPAAPSIPVPAPAPRPVPIEPSRPAAATAPRPIEPSARPSPPALAPAPAPRRVPAPLPPAPRIEPRIEPPPELPVALGLGFSLVDSAAYEWTVDGVGKVDTQVDRNDMFLSISKGGLRARVGLVFSASVDDQVDSGDLLLRQVEVSDGQGWWAAIDYRGRVWAEGPWAVNLGADGVYRSETYTLSYDAWTAGQVVSAVGTNDASTNTVWRYTRHEEDLSFSEVSVRAGCDVSYSGRQWEAYAGPRFLFVGSTDFSGTLNAGNGTYAFDLDRAGTLTLAAGLRVDSKALRWYVEAELGDDTALRAGVCREL